MFFKDDTIKEEEEEEIESSFAKRHSKRPSSQEFKDLKPQNQKRRKEPKKPWGKKERIILFLTILLTSLTSLFLLLSSYSWKIKGLPRIYIDLSKSPIFGEEVITLEANEKNKEKEEIISGFKEKTKDLSGVYGLYIVNLKDGFSYGINEDEIFQAASLIKLPVMAAAFLESESGNFNLDDKYKLQNSDKISGSGSLYSKPEGYEVSYRDLVRLMGKQSDDTAFNILRKKLGDAKIEEFIKKFGMSKTSLKENETTPKDIGIFFSNLWKGNILSNKLRDEILESLTDTIYENWLASGIFKHVRIAHKYGREVNVVNDAGIVFSEKPFVIVVLSKGVKTSEADEIFPEISKFIYEVKSLDY